MCTIVCSTNNRHMLGITGGQSVPRSKIRNVRISDRFRLPIFYPHLDFEFVHAKPQCSGLQHRCVQAKMSAGRCHGHERGAANVLSWAWGVLWAPLKTPWPL